MPLTAKFAFNLYILAILSEPYLAQHYGRDNLDDSVDHDYRTEKESNGGLGFKRLEKADYTAYGNKNREDI